MASTPISGPLTARQIAQTAGVGVGTLYRHFPERPDLILGIVDEIAQQVEALATKALADWEAGPQGAWAEFVRGCGALRTGAIATGSNAPTALAEKDLGPFMERRDRLMQVLTPVLDRARSHGLIEPTLTPQRFFIGLGAITRPLPEPASRVFPHEEMDAWLVEIYLRGLRPDDSQDHKQ
ncbi:TetR/AcrR family transcriptional regulator [Kocuria sp. JC486]|nr:TetR/AcrR family transcriptional regulator [Kocuria sp. JC486]